MLNRLLCGVAIMLGMVVPALSEAQCRCKSCGDTLLRWCGAPPSERDGGDEPLVTDRPDFTEASSTVGCGRVQLEAGYTYFYDEEGGTSEKAHSGPEALWRIGVFRDWLEFRIAWNYAEVTQSGNGPTQTFTGADDLYLGFKIALTPQQGMLPEMAILPQMTVPTGSAPFNNNQVLPGVNWLYSWDLNECWSVAGSSQFNRVLDGQTNDNYVEFAQSATAGRAFTDAIGGYAEWYAFFPSGADTDTPQHFFNGGLTYLVHNDLQLDVRAGVGLNDAATDYFVGAGFAYRY